LVLYFFLVFFFCNSLSNCFKKNNCQACMHDRSISKKGFFREKSSSFGKRRKKTHKSFFWEKKLFCGGKEKQNNLLFLPLLFLEKKPSFCLFFFL
jgi:hypothetical protein